MKVRTMSDQDIKYNIYQYQQFNDGSYDKWFYLIIDLGSGETKPLWRVVKPLWIKKDKSAAGIVSVSDLKPFDGYLLKYVRITYSSQSNIKKVTTLYYLLNGGQMFELHKEGKEIKNGVYYDVIKVDDKKVKVGKDKIEIERYTT